MGADTKVSGKKITWMVLANIPGQTAEHIKASTKMTRSMAMEFMSGRMNANTPVNGSKANSTVLEYTKCPGMQK